MSITHRIFNALIILFMIFVVNNTNAQSIKKIEISNKQESSDSCEDSSFKLNSVKTYFTNEKEVLDNSIIIIAYSSKEENSRKMNQKRLHLAQEGLIKLGVDKDDIILAEAITISSLPKLDFYINGRIVDSITSNHNALFCIEYCTK